MAAACAALLVAAASFQGGPAAAETLAEALARAYQDNPVLLARRAQLRATDEGVAQARSSWRPTIRLEGDMGVSRNETEPSGSTVAADDTLHPSSLALNIEGPLYRGGIMAAGIEAAESRVGAGRADLRAVEQAVMLDGVTAYMDVLHHRSALDLSLGNERVVRRHFEAAQARFEVGEVTRTDVAQAEARLAQATADRIAAEGRLISARGAYRQAIGALPGALSWPAFPTGLPESEQEALAIADAAHPAIGAADHSARAARADIRTARSALLPRVSFRGRYGARFDQSSAVDESRTASLTATVTVPLYQSGAEHARVRQARQAAAQRSLDVDRARRAVLAEVTRAWEALETARARITAFESQVRAATIALEGVENEALVGLRTTLDVLDAEQELFEARVNLVRARRDETVSAYRVKSSIGALTARRLGLPVALYDAEEHYEAVRDRWFGLGDLPRAP